MKPTSQPLKNKTSHDAQREFGGTLGEWTRAALLFNLIIHQRLIPNLYPPLRGPVYPHLPSLDGSVPDLCEPILRGRCAPVAPSPALL